MCQQIRDTAEIASSYFFGKSVDHFVFLLDGQKMGQPAGQSAELGQIKKLFQRLLEIKVININSYCQIVLTKVDVLLKENNGEELLKAIKKRIVDKFSEFNNSVNGLDIYFIAACPQSFLPAGKNEFISLISNWLHNRRSFSEEPKWDWAENIKPRKIDCF